jgi:hypothetical protein
MQPIAGNHQKARRIDMNLDEVISAIGGPVQLPAKPDGPSEIQPLTSGGLDKGGVVEPAPANVSAQQGAGGGYLYPGAQGTAADGTVEAGSKDHYGSGGPEQLPASTGVSALTPDPSHGRPDGGADNQPAAPAGSPRDPRLGGDQTGQGINPALKAALQPRQPRQSQGWKAL